MIKMSNFAPNKSSDGEQIQLEVGFNEILLEQKVNRKIENRKIGINHLPFTIFYLPFTDNK